MRDRAYTRIIQVDKADRERLQHILDSTGRGDALFMRKDTEKHSTFWVKIKKNERMLIKLSIASAAIAKIKKV